FTTDIWRFSGRSYEVARPLLGSIGGVDRDRGVDVGKPTRLPLPQARVGAAADEQLGVRTFLDDPALVENNETVHAGNGRQPMSNGDDRATAHQAVELFLDRRFDFRIER